MLFKWSPIGDTKHHLDGLTSAKRYSDGSEHRFSTGILCVTVVTFGLSKVEVKSFVVGLYKSWIVPLELRILLLLFLFSVHFSLFLKIVVLGFFGGFFGGFLWAPASAHGLASACIMSTEIGRVKGKYTGLKAYLKIFLSELSSYVSSEDCEQDKLLGYKHNVIYEP